MGITTTEATKNRHRTLVLFPAAGSAAMLLLSSHALAVEWEFEPTLELRETYTDNLRLSDTDEESEFITQVNPGIRVSGLGPRLKFNARYQMQNLAYAREHESNATNHQLNAVGNAELLEDHLFLDANAAVSQRAISSFGPDSSDNTNITNNRTNVETYSISPYLLNHFQDFATGEIRYTRDSVSTSGGGSAVSSGFSDSTSDKILLKLTSGEDFRILRWGLNYDKQRIDFDSGQTVDQVTYGGDIRYRITPRFSLIANGGYERNDYASITGESAGSFWRAGFAWAPSRRTDIEAQAGKRYFGDSYYVRASHRSRRTALNLSYSEDVTSTREQFTLPATIDTAAFLDQLWTNLFPDPVLRQQLIASFISENGLPESLAEPVNFLTNRFFLQKRFQASISVTGARNTAVLSLFDIRREAQTSQLVDNPFLGPSDLSFDDNTKQQGIQAVLTRKVAPQTNANLSLGLTKTSSGSTNREDKEKSLRLSLTKSLLENVRGALEFRHRDRDSNEASATEYTENALTGSLLIKF